MLIHELVTAFMQLDFPIGSWILLSFALIPVMVGALRSAMTFQSEFIVHRRLKNIERSLAAAQEQSADHALLLECRAEEAVFINVGLRLSPYERATVLQWIRSSSVSISLIKSAWPQVAMVEGRLRIELSRWDRIYMWYGIATFGVTFIFATALLLLVFPQALLQGKIQLMALPAIVYLVSALALKETKPFFSARRLKNRLAMAVVAHNAAIWSLNNFPSLV